MEAIQTIREGKEKYAMILSKEDVQIVNVYLNARLETMKNEKYDTKLLSTGTMPMNYMSNFINEIFTQLITAGIPQYLQNRLLGLLPHPYDNKEPKEFSLDDLWFGFSIWLIACGISTSVFIMEVLIFWTRYWVQNITGMIVLLKHFDLILRKMQFK